MKYIKKHKYIYLFILTFSIIGFITGYFFYQTQQQSTKNEIKEAINIKEDLKAGTNNISKRIKQIFIIFISSIFCITIISNYLKVFTEPFQIGFITAFLLSIGTKFTIIYLTIYHLIPLILILIIIRISATITYNIIKLLIYRDNKSKKQLIVIIKKYILISIILIIYELIISIISPNINAYLMTII